MVGHENRSVESESETATDGWHARMKGRCCTVTMRKDAFAIVLTELAAECSQPADETTSRLASQRASQQ
eukprot:287093-Heterocapsa_arctica.AAC.1